MVRNILARLSFVAVLLVGLLASGSARASSDPGRRGPEGESGLPVAAAAPSEPALECDQIPMLRSACGSAKRSGRGATTTPSAAACYQLALCLHEGEWVLRSDRVAVDYLARACELRHRDACVELAAWREGGWPPPVDMAAAADAHERACALGVGRSCAQAGLSFELGLAGPIDLPRALAAYSSGYARGDRDATVQLARLHRVGQSRYPSPHGEAWELRLQESACGGDDPEACAAFADALARGRGGPADPARALDLARVGCDGGHGPACTVAGRILAPERPVEAALVLERACALEDGPGCVRLGALLVAPGPAASPARGVFLLERACGTGDERACGSLMVARARARAATDEAGRACGPARDPRSASPLCGARCEVDPGAGGCAPRR